MPFSAWKGFSKESFELLAGNWCVWDVPEAVFTFTTFAFVYQFIRCLEDFRSVNLLNEIRKMLRQRVLLLAVEHAMSWYAAIISVHGAADTEHIKVLFFHILVNLVKAFFISKVVKYFPSWDNTDSNSHASFEGFTINLAFEVVVLVVTGQDTTETRL